MGQPITATPVAIMNPFKTLFVITLAVRTASEMPSRINRIPPNNLGTPSKNCLTGVSASIKREIKTTKMAQQTPTNTDLITLF